MVRGAERPTRKAIGATISMTSQPQVPETEHHLGVPKRPNGASARREFLGEGGQRI